MDRVMQRHHGHRYYDWALEDGQLRYFEHPVNLPREKKYEGKYVIQSEQANITPEEAVARYKELNVMTNKKSRPYAIRTDSETC